MSKRLSKQGIENHRQDRYGKLPQRLFTLVNFPIEYLWITNLRSTNGLRSPGTRPWSWRAYSWKQWSENAANCQSQYFRELPVWNKNHLFIRRRTKKIITTYLLWYAESQTHLHDKWPQPATHKCQESMTVSMRKTKAERKWQSYICRHKHRVKQSSVPIIHISY